ncbi:hypothetical protein [Providencia alcalifaciens]|uniref:hypothetical protein n=1 Tax=Providencia alcalifaciens TaxID=126385 RepID=UPI00055B1CD2|nr:hypothetical protein [Providencia alcalifaciens]
MKSILQLLLLGLIGFIFYAYNETEEIKDRVSKLESTPRSQWSSEDAKFMSDREKSEKERAERRRINDLKMKQEAAEKKAKEEQYYLEHKDEIDKNRARDKVFAKCLSAAKNSLRYPKSYEQDHISMGDKLLSDRPIYYVYLEFSGVNSFNVRGTNKMTCYGFIDMKDSPVVYTIN